MIAIGLIIGGIMILLLILGLLFFLFLDEETIKDINQYYEDNQGQQGYDFNRSTDYTIF